MLRWSLELFSPYQIMLGLTYHRGIEVFENQEDGEDIKLNFHELQFGLIIFLMKITLYTSKKEE